MNRRAMRVFGISIVVLGMLFVVAGSHVALAENSVTVETLLGQAPNAEVELHIKIINDVDLRQFLLPVILRKWDGDAYVTAVKPVFRERLLPVDGNILSSVVFVNQYIQANDGTCKRYSGGDTPDLTKNYRGFGTIEQAGIDTTKRSIEASKVVVGYLFNRTMIPSLSQPLPPGEDESGSVVLILNLNASEGCFNVDTTCTNPANHFLMVGTDGLRLPDQTFNAGQVCIIRETGVRDISASDAGVPEDYKLGQNYPNPFNAGTVIEFTNKTDGHVSLEVFNILGQHVVTLLDDYKDYGKYAVDWDGRDSRGEQVPSGMYFYRVRAGDFTAVKKMVLLK
jgi:hypothetical protein